MSTKMIVFALITFLHNLFTAIWVGGLFTLALSVMPSAKQVLGMNPQTKKLLNAIMKRHSLWVYISLIGLILTGLLQSNRSTQFLGLFSFGNTYSVILSLKHIAVILMIAIALYRSLALKNISNAKQEKLKASLLMVNLVLGILVLLLSGFTSALTTSVPAL